jgi:hypothetical protein
MGTSNKDADGVGAFAAIDATKPHRFARDRTAAATDGTGTMGVKPEAERKAEFFAGDAALRRSRLAVAESGQPRSRRPRDHRRSRNRPRGNAEGEGRALRDDGARAEVAGFAKLKFALAGHGGYDRAGRAGFAPIINPRVSRMEKPNH